MIERKFVSQNMKEYKIQEFITKNLPKVGLSHIKLQRTPLGEKIIIYASRPGLVVGTKGQNIMKLTELLKKKFGLENPQIEIGEIENINLDAKIIAEKIASLLERFGTTRFKAVGHKTMESVMGAGALGIEIIISGKLPGARAKSWRFYNGYLKKCGDIAEVGVDKAYATANLKSGAVGIRVSIMPPTVRLPDRVELVAEKEEKIEEIKEKEEDDKEKEKEKKKVDEKKKE